MPFLSLKLPYFVHLHSADSLKQIWMEMVFVFPSDASRLAEFHLFVVLKKKSPKSETLTHLLCRASVCQEHLVHVKETSTIQIQVLLRRLLLTASGCYANFLPPCLIRSPAC